MYGTSRDDHCGSVKKIRMRLNRKFWIAANNILIEDTALIERTQGVCHQG